MFRCGEVAVRGAGMGTGWRKNGGTDGHNVARGWGKTYGTERDRKEERSLLMPNGLIFYFVFKFFFKDTQREGE